MELLDDVANQVLRAPPWLTVLLAMTLLSVAWRKSQWPNRYLPFATLVLGVSAYSVLCWDLEAYRVFYRPQAVAIFHGVLLWLGNEVFHEGIVTLLKNKFPKLKFPDDTPKPVPIPIETKPLVPPTP